MGLGKPIRKEYSLVTRVLIKCLKSASHHYHPSQCSRSWHTASREYHSPPPSPVSWWRDRPEQTQTHADTHLHGTWHTETVHGYCWIFWGGVCVCLLTSLVHYKVFIDCEGGLYWTVLVYFLFNFILFWRDAVWGFTYKQLNYLLHCCHQDCFSLVHSIYKYIFMYGFF